MAHTSSYYRLDRKRDRKRKFRLPAVNSEKNNLSELCGFLICKMKKTPPTPQE